MPLHDHFHSPVNDTHSWDELYGGWPMELVRHLRGILPPGYRAAPNIHLGSSFEVDIDTFEADQDAGSSSPSPRDLAQPATIPAPTATLTIEAEPLDLDEYEVFIYDTQRGRRLVAAIELVSPSNKDRHNHRQAFLSKVWKLLQQDVCVSIVDLVTIRRHNLYSEFLDKLNTIDNRVLAPNDAIYAVTLRRRPQSQPDAPAEATGELEAWYQPMSVGQPLPTLPVWLRHDLAIQVDLNVSYHSTCEVLDIPT